MECADDGGGLGGLFESRGDREGSPKDERHGCGDGSGVVVEVERADGGGKLKAYKRYVGSPLRQWNLLATAAGSHLRRQGFSLTSLYFHCFSTDLSTSLRTSDVV